MSESHRPRPQWSRMGLWLLSLITVAGLGLATAPAQASPLRPPAPLDAQSAVGQVGPTIVDIDTKLGYQSAVGAGTGIVIGPSTRKMLGEMPISNMTTSASTAPRNRLTG